MTPLRARQPVAQRPSGSAPLSAASVVSPRSRHRSAAAARTSSSSAERARPRKGAGDKGEPSRSRTRPRRRRACRSHLGEQADHGIGASRAGARRSSSTVSASNLRGTTTSTRCEAAFHSTERSSRRSSRSQRGRWGWAAESVLRCMPVRRSSTSSPRARLLPRAAVLRDLGRASAEAPSPRRRLPTRSGTP